MSKGASRALEDAAQDGRVVAPRVIPFDVTIDVADGAPGFGAGVIGGLPEGNILVLGGVSYATFTKVSGAITDTFTGNYSIGSAPTADGTLNGEEVNVIPSSAISAATAGVSPRTRGAGATASVVDNTAADRELNLNLTIADAAISGAGVVRAQGELHVVYLPKMGDD